MNPEADQQDVESTNPESVDLEITTQESVDLVSLGAESLDIELVDPVSVGPASVDLVVLQSGAAAGTDADVAAAPAGLLPAGPAVAATKRRAGVPVWRTGKPDAFLAAAVDTARTAISGITEASDIGQHLAAKSEGDRLVTHLFECRLPGYGGWQWFAVLTRNSRSKVVTVNELGLLPSEESILAPEWVPWAERVRPGDEQEQEPETGEHAAREPEAGEPEAGAHQAEAPEAAHTESADGDDAALRPAGMDAVNPDGDAQKGEALDGAPQDAETADAPEQRFEHDAGPH